TPGGEDAFGKSIFTGPANVIHDFVAAVFDDALTNSPGDVVERGVPGRLLPLAFAAFAGALERIEYPIGIVNLIERCRTLGAVSPAAPGVLGIAFKLLYLASDLVDVSEQAAGR